MVRDPSKRISASELFERLIGVRPLPPVDLFRVCLIVEPTEEGVRRRQDAGRGQCGRHGRGSSRQGGRLIEP